LHSKFRKKMKHLNKIILLITALAISSSATAQCAMCKATAESSKDVGGGLNAGIEYIMLFPYILLVLFVFIAFSNKKLKQFVRELFGFDKNKKDDFDAESWY